MRMQVVQFLAGAFELYLHRNHNSSAKLSRFRTKKIPPITAETMKNASSSISTTKDTQSVASLLQIHLNYINTKMYLYKIYKQVLFSKYLKIGFYKIRKHEIIRCSASSFIFIYFFGKQIFYLHATNLNQICGSLVENSNQANQQMFSFNLFSDNLQRI